jgi:hypothetical protein
MIVKTGGTNSYHYALKYGSVVKLKIPTAEIGTVIASRNFEGWNSTR